MTTSGHPARTRRDQSVRLLRSGYLFASRIRRRAGVEPDSQVPVELRLMGRKTVLLRGIDGVRAFYDADRVARFAAIVDEELHAMLGDWARRGAGTVYHDTSAAFGRAAFRWDGLSLSRSEADRRAVQMSRLLDTFGRPPSNPVAVAERLRLDRWATGIIRAVRSGGVGVDKGSVVAAMADLRDENGELVDDRTAGVELQNLTRPTVAVGRFAGFAAVAPVSHPEWAERIRRAGTNGRGRAHRDHRVRRVRAGGPSHLPVRPHAARTGDEGFPGTGLSDQQGAACAPGSARNQHRPGPLAGRERVRSREIPGRRPRRGA